MTQSNPLSKQTQTEAFKRWFAGSCLADDQGNPMILYHGTRPGNDITEFELPNAYDGMYFTPDPLYAEGFTSELFSDEPASGGMFPVYLSIKNPLVVTADEGDDAWEAFCYRGINRQELEAKGYDGAILIEKSTGIIDQVQAYHPSQIKSAIGNRGTFDPTVSDIRYALSDPRYMFAGPQAETSDLTSFDQARKLESKKVDKNTIWRETGWMRGVDGNWRFEISDEDARLNIGVPEAFEDEIFERLYREIQFTEERGLIKALYRENQEEHLGAFGHTREDAWRNLQYHLIKREFPGIYSVESIKGQTLLLEEVMDHPQLFSAYPRLKEMPITFDDRLPDNEWGEFDHGSGITINANLPHDKILTVIIHEAQHAIQEAEGFAYGGQPQERFTRAVKDRLKSLSIEQQANVDQWTQQHAHLLDAEQASSDMVTYALMYRSMERLRQYACRDRPSGVLRLIRNECGWVYHDKVRESSVAKRFDEAQRNWKCLPKRHRMQARNRFLQDHCMEVAECLSEVIPKPIAEQFRNESRQLNSLLKSLERQASKARSATAPLRELKQKEKTAEKLAERHHYSSAFQVYQALAGEIEARNTEHRRTLTEAERRQTTPESTADIKSDEAIVIFRDKRNFKVEVPYRSALTTVPLRPAMGRTQRGQPGLSKHEAQLIADNLLKGWQGRPPVHAVNRLNELPKTLQRDIWKKRADRDVRAAFHNNAVYLIAPRLPDRNALEEVLLHEVVGHFGLRALLGERLTSTLERIYESMGETALALEIREAYFREAPFDPNNAEHRHLVAEELMAKLAESGAHQDLSDSALYESEVRDGLRAMGFQLPLTRTDLLAILRGAEEVLHSGGLSRPSPADTFFRRAYHGSPHQFDQFSLSAIGTGEGAQAFGWGLYFSARREVAEFYKDALSESMMIGQTAGWNTIGASSTAKELLRSLPMSAAIAYAQAREGKMRGLYDGVADELRAIEVRGQEQTDSFLYEVDIPDDAELLDADKPLTEQPGAIYRILRDSQILEITGNEAWNVSAHMIDGHGLYDLLRQWFVEDDMAWEELGKTPHQVTSIHQAVSEYLNSLGIPGLRYLDGNSRATGTGEHNYVIWDDRVVTIQAVNDEIHQAYSALQDAEPRETRFARRIHELQTETGPANEPAAGPEQNNATGSDRSRETSAPLSFDGARDRAATTRGQRSYESTDGVALREPGRTDRLSRDDTLLDKALFLIRWRMMDKLAWFDRLDPPGRDNHSLSATWADHHAAFFDKHMQVADNQNKTLSELEYHYLKELQNELEKDRQGQSDTQMSDLKNLLDSLEVMTSEAQRFLKAWSEEPSEIAFKARRAIHSLDQGVWPFQRSPKPDQTALDSFMSASKMKHDNGKPMLLYHATNADFTNFDPMKSTGVAGSGIYLTPQKPQDDQYGGFVMPLYANIRNPVDFTAGDQAINQFAKHHGVKTLSECTSIPELRDWSAEFRKVVLSEGYDGARIIAPDGGTYVVAYHANQVKSALGNSGLFDPSTSDIRFKRERQTPETVAGAGTPRMNIDEIRQRIPELMQQVDAAYGRGDMNSADVLDAELESLFDRLEHGLADLEEDGLTKSFANSGEEKLQAAGLEQLIGSEDDNEASLELCLASTYAKYLDPLSYIDKESAITNGRANIDMFGGDTEGASDDQILEAMRDAHDWVMAARSRGGPKIPSFGTPVTAASFQRQSEMDEPDEMWDEPALG